MISLFAFYLFAAILLVAATLVITARNPVHSVLWLIVAFFNAAGLMLIVGAEFIAMLLVIVYVGAVAVLFLFVVMMLDLDFSRFREGFTRYVPLGLLVALVLVAEILIATRAWGEGLALRGATAGGATPGGATSGHVPNIEAIGLLLYRDYLFVFEGAGLVLLVAMIGAIVLTHRERRGGKVQSIARQNRRRPDEAVRLAQPQSGEGVEL